MIDPDGEPWTLERFTAGVETTGVWSTVDLREVLPTLRVDSDPYTPEHLALAKRIDRLTEKGLAKPIGEIATVEYGHMPMEDYVGESEGETLIRVTNIKDKLNVEFDDVKYIDCSLKISEEKRVRRGDVLLVQLGSTTGKVAYIDSDLDGLVFPSYCLRIRSSTVPGEYLALFLDSELGQRQLWRLITYATVRPNTSKPQVESLVVPLNDDATIKYATKAVLKASELRRESHSRYAEAEALLLSELGLDDLDLSHQRTYTQNASQVWEAGRLDPEYFQPKYTRVETTLRSCRFPCCNLGELIAPIMNGFDYRDYVDAGTPYIRVGDVSNGRIDLEGAEKVDITIEDVSKDVDLRPGDIVFTRKGTFGRAAVVREGQEHAIISSEIMRLRLKDPRVKPDYLALFLNSVAGYQQIEQRVHGVAFFSISQDDLASITVSIPSEDVQERVGQLVVHSIEAENEAKLLLEEAKRRVEEMVLGEGALDVTTG